MILPLLLLLLLLMMCYSFPFLCFCFFCLLLLLLVVCLYVFFFSVFFVLFCFCFSFIKLVLYRFLAWFSISLTYLKSYTCNSLLYNNPKLYKHLLYPNKAQCHFFVYPKVGGGQLESLCYFDLHTHFVICTVFILSCNHLL